MTCFERIVNKDPHNTFAGEWYSVYRVLMHKEYDLNVWHGDFDDIMRRLGTEMDGDIIRINDELYYVNCAAGVICEFNKASFKEDFSHE